MFLISLALKLTLALLLNSMRLYMLCIKANTLVFICTYIVQQVLYSLIMPFNVIYQI